MSEQKKRTSSRAKLVPAMSLRVERSNPLREGDCHGLRPRNDSPAEKITYEPPETENSFDPSFLAEFRGKLASGLTASSAVDLIAKLMAQVPAASKEGQDQIKILDKLLNTARAMMEARLKMDEAAAISARLNELETRIDDLTRKLSGSCLRNP